MNVSAERRRAAFIDRDGVLNEERGYVHRIADFQLLPGVIEGLRILRDAGFDLVVVTNQAGIARGYYDENALGVLHEHLRSLLADEGIQLRSIKFCPHHPQATVAQYRKECDCRKPSPGMILEAAQEFNLDLAESVLIGDKVTDLQAGISAGVGTNVLVRSGHAVSTHDEAVADFLVDDLLSAARRIELNRLRSRS